MAATSEAALSYSLERISSIPLFLSPYVFKLTFCSSCPHHHEHVPVILHLKHCADILLKNHICIITQNLFFLHYMRKILPLSFQFRICYCFTHCRNLTNTWCAIAGLHTRRLNSDRSPAKKYYNTVTRAQMQ